MLWVAVALIMVVKGSEGVGSEGDKGVGDGALICKSCAFSIIKVAMVVLMAQTRPRRMPPLALKPATKLILEVCLNFICSVVLVCTRVMLHLGRGLSNSDLELSSRRRRLLRRAARFT